MCMFINSVKGGHTSFEFKARIMRPTIRHMEETTVSPEGCRIYRVILPYGILSYLGTVV